STSPAQVGWACASSCCSSASRSGRSCCIAGTTCSGRMRSKRGKRAGCSRGLGSAVVCVVLTVFPSATVSAEGGEAALPLLLLYALHLRALLEPAGMLLIGIGHTQYGGFVKWLPGNLQPHRQPGGGETTGDGDGLHARHVVRPGETGPPSGSHAIKSSKGR